jgi:hypothetical protein
LMHGDETKSMESPLPQFLYSNAWAPKLANRLSFPPFLISKDI